MKSAADIFKGCRMRFFSAVFPPLKLVVFMHVVIPEPLHTSGRHAPALKMTTHIYLYVRVS
ncbi:hypothetical protein [Rhizobium sp. N122]|uniref:hypothetical protein n=1 Tax=Rhizobium sp. N122 TaxID=1764272 RepID=UPI00117B0B2A|nr:hypothetical protein [Rhizobium sp. N122]